MSSSVNVLATKNKQQQRGICTNETAQAKIFHHQIKPGCEGVTSLLFQVEIIQNIRNFMLQVLFHVISF